MPTYHVATSCFSFAVSLLNRCGCRCFLCDRRVVCQKHNKSCFGLLHGKRGRIFPVRRGVAQGCVLSPLLFNVYVDDLLQRVRDTGIGVSVGKALLAALAFADDLVLGGDNRSMRRSRREREVDYLCSSSD